MKHHDWADALEEIANRGADVIPAEWTSCQSLSDDPGSPFFKRSPYRIRLQMLQLIGIGRAERKKFMVMTGGGLRPQYYYRLLKKKS